VHIYSFDKNTTSLSMFVERLSFVLCQMLTDDWRMTTIEYEIYTNHELQNTLLKEKGQQLK